MKLLQLILILYPFFSNGQTNDIRRTYHWHFGSGLSLDFSSGSPQVGSSSITSWEGVASISDTCGSLLFYTNGNTVWNKNNQIMLNGTGLLGPTYTSSMQGTIIVPQPGNDSLFYIFTNDDLMNFGQNGHRYHIVNINLDNGLGSVISKNNLLYGTSLEKLGATRHQNGIDYWVVSRQYDFNNYITDRYVAYLLTAQGLNPTPTYSYTGGKQGSLGYIRFNADGRKMAAAMNGDFNQFVDTLDIYDFDNLTGTVSSPIFQLTIGDTNSIHGVCFSPDNTKLYATYYDWFYQDDFKFVQFDLSSGVQSTILASMTILDQSDSFSFRSMQLGPDKKIYMTTMDLMEGVSDSLAIINYPDSLGFSCGYEKNGLFVNNTNNPTNFLNGVPNFVDSYLYQPFSPPCSNELLELSGKQKTLSKVVDPLGRETEIKPNTILIYVYSDGTTEKVYQVK